MKNQTLISLLLSVFIALLGIGIIVPVLPVFAKELGAGGIGLGMIIASFSVVRGLLQPIVGNLSDTLGRKRFLLAGLLIYGLVGLLVPQATSVNHLIGIRGFHGVGSAMIVPIAMAYMSLLSPSGHEGRYMSYLNISIFCGIGCGPIIGGFLFDNWGLRSVFYSMAALSFFAFVLVMTYMPAKVGTGKTETKKLIPTLRAMIGSQKTSGILLARYATMIIMVPTMAFLPLLMSGWEGNSGLRVGIVIACRTLVNALLQVPFGKLADRTNKSYMLLINCLALGGVLVFIPSFTTFPMMALAYSFLGFIEAGIWAVLGAYASIEAKEQYGHGTMMGVFSLAMSGGVFTGAMLSGVSMDGWGIARAYHITGAAVTILCVIAFMMITRGEKGTNGELEHSAN
jgi:DHA1 family multidrug resistance protein-like MFS transporter